MRDIAKVALELARKDAAPRAALALRADEQLADGSVVAIVRRQVPGPPAGMAGIGFVADERVERPFGRLPGQTARSTSSFLVSAMALAGFSPLGQTLAQFMIVWQR